jgi:ABC-type multidrug transport system fused ATPase/permease subunit
VLASIGVEGVLSKPFSSMLGTAGGTTLAEMARGAWQAAVLPIGCGVLSMVFTVQLVHISQRMDGNASVPAIREVVFLLVFFAVNLFLVQNSFELMRALYEVARLAITRVTALFGTGGAMDLSAVSIVTEDDDVAALLAMVVVALVSWLVVVVAYVVALVVTWARAIQLYVMAALSPIPLALLGLDETRQMGVGYLRQFASVCLAGLVITLLLIAFPVVLGGLNAGERRHRNARRLGCGRAQLRAPVPRHVRPARALAREERGMGQGRPRRVANRFPTGGPGGPEG